MAKSLPTTCQTPAHILKTHQAKYSGLVVPDQDTCSRPRVLKDPCAAPALQKRRRNGTRKMKKMMTTLMAEVKTPSVVEVVVMASALEAVVLVMAAAIKALLEVLGVVLDPALWLPKSKFNT